MKTKNNSPKTQNNSKNKHSHHHIPHPLLTLLALTSYLLTRSLPNLISRLISKIHSSRTSHTSHISHISHTSHPSHISHIPLSSLSLPPLTPIFTSISSISSSLISSLSSFLAQIKSEFISLVSFIVSSILTLFELILKSIIRLLSLTLSLLTSLFILAFHFLKLLISIILKSLSCLIHFLTRYPIIIILALCLTITPILSSHLTFLNQPDEILEDEPTPIDDPELSTFNTTGIKLSQLDGITASLIDLTLTPDFKYVLPLRVSVNHNPIQIEISYTTLSSLISEGHAVFVQNILLSYCSNIQSILANLDLGSYDYTVSVIAEEAPDFVIWVIELVDGEPQIIHNYLE